MKRDIIKIVTPSLFNFTECLWFLNRNFDDCLHEISGNSIRKAISIVNEIILVELYEIDQHLEIKVLQGELKNEQQLIDYVEDWLDMKRDIRPFYKLLKLDKELFYLADTYKGLRAIGIPNLFEALCWSIIGQQINLTFAYTLKRRLLEKHGKRIIFNNKTYYLFPEPASIEKLSVEELRAMQFSRRKAEYLIGIAAQFNSGTISKAKIAALENETAMFNQLIAIRGVGEWTAHYVLMKSFRNMNSITYGDAGLNNALLKIKGFDKKNNRKEIDHLFQKFEGWKGYLIYYLWRSLSNSDQTLHIE